MSGSLIERVARAINPTAFVIGPAQKRRAMAQAREAIEAMRDPSNEMIIAGGGPENTWDVSSNLHIKRREAEFIYKKMIDAALEQ